jgi:hypothetical protein
VRSPFLGIFLLLSEELIVMYALVAVLNYNAVTFVDSPTTRYFLALLWCASIQDAFHIFSLLLSMNTY